MKQVLVIDVPDDFETKTAIAIVDIKNEKGEGVTAMCPLKPMPNKLDANDWHRMFGGTYGEREAKGYGWNACLEEITR